MAIQTIYCWISFYKAQFIHYDDNYGMLIHGFIIALFTLVIIAIIFVLKKDLIKDNKITINIWTVIGSPLTFIIATLYYEVIFATKLIG